MNNGDLGDLRNLIKNLLDFAENKNDALDEDSAPLWHYIKENYNSEADVSGNNDGKDTRISLDSILLNDIFLFLSYLCLSDNEISDDELKFINHVLDLNFKKEEFSNYLKTNLREDYASTLPYSFSLFYEFDKYLRDNGRRSNFEIVESLFDAFERLGVELVRIDGVLDDERIAYESFMDNLRKNLDDLKAFNYSLMVLTLKFDSCGDFLDSNALDEQFQKDIDCLNNNFEFDSPISTDIISDVKGFLFKDNAVPERNKDNPLLESFDSLNNNLESFKRDSSDSDSFFNEDSSDSSFNGDSSDSSFKGDSSDLSFNEDSSDFPSPDSAIVTASEETPDDEESLEDILSKLNRLVGLESVKNDVNSLINLIQIRKIREERGIKQPDMSLHLVFSGNPGTGKTTVARLLGSLYSKLGILSKGHLVETDRSGLVAGYVGQTAIKTQDMIKEAMGGILFIDEAYSLSSSKGENDFGQESIDTILKAMEDNREDFIVIVAGYPKLMDDFLQSNPGLESRFNKHLFFEDYTPQELFDIFVSMADESSLKLDEKAENFLKGHFEDIYKCRGDNFANGRYVRNLFERVLSNQANRLVNIEELSDDDLNTLTIDDFNDCV